MVTMMVVTTCGNNSGVGMLKVKVTQLTNQREGIFQWINQGRKSSFKKEKKKISIIYLKTNRSIYFKTLSHSGTLERLSELYSILLLFYVCKKKLVYLQLEILFLVSKLK